MRVARFFMTVAAAGLVLASSSFSLAQDLDTRYGKFSIVAFDRQGNPIEGNGLKAEYKKIQYLLNDRVVKEEVDEKLGKPIPELVKVFQQSKSDAVLVLTDSSESTGACAIRFVDVTASGATLSNIFNDCKGEPRFARKGDTIRVVFKEAKPMKVATYVNGAIK